METREAFFAAAAAIAVVLWAQPSPAAMEQTEIISSADSSPDVEVTNVRSEDSVVSGTLVNRSSQPVRNVRVLIDHVWYWKNERHPGEDNPGRAEFHTIQGEIPPGGNLPFKVNEPPLPRRADGSYQTTAHVIEWLEGGAIAADQPRSYERPAGAYRYPSGSSTGQYPSGTYEPPADSPEYNPPVGAPY